MISKYDMEVLKSNWKERFHENITIMTFNLITLSLPLIHLDGFNEYPLAIQRSPTQLITFICCASDNTYVALGFIQ